MAMSDAGLDLPQADLECPEQAVLWAGLDADQVKQVHDNHEDAEHAPNHD